MVYRALAGHCCPTDIYQAHMSGSAKSQQYGQRLKQAYSRTDGSWASGKQVPDRLGLIARLHTCFLEIKAQELVRSKTIERDNRQIFLLSQEISNLFHLSVFRLH